jgi:hypothetical protein
MEKYEQMPLNEFNKYLLRKVKIDFYEVINNNAIEKTMVGFITECTVGSKKISIEKTQIDEHILSVCKFLNESDNQVYPIMIRNIRNITLITKE